MAIDSILISKLHSLLGENRVITHPDELIVFECDGLTLHKQMPDAVVLPKTTEEVSEIIKLCQTNHTPFLARGSGTGLSGGAIAAEGGVIIQMSLMKQILKIDYENEIAVVQPGVINLNLTNEIIQDGYHFAPDPSSQKACTIGGNVAENAGGPHTLKYGVTANHVLGLKVVMPTGDIVELGGKIEEFTGYDLVGVFVGSEGTLGITTEITVKLTRNPEGVKTFLATFNKINDASNTVSKIIELGIIPAAMELIDNLVIQAVESHLKAGFPTKADAILLIEIDGVKSTLTEEAKRIESICFSQNAANFQEAQTMEERDLLWRGRKEAIGALGKITPAFYTNDGVIPRSKLPEILEFDLEIGKQYGLEVAHICHAGDGNIHPIILYNPDNKNEIKSAIKISEAILKKCIELGGALTGEHGIGTEKLSALGVMYSDNDQNQMLRLRTVFNPTDLLNPGKIFPEGAKCGESRINQTIIKGGWI